MSAAPGLFGKLPSRGDFVRLGLARDFSDHWDQWWQPALLTASERPDWRDAWLQAPVWQFALAPGACGRQAALGVFMPSVDSVGRYFPLTLAALFASGESGWDEAFLQAAEQAGRDALERDLEPDEVLARLPTPSPSSVSQAPPACRFRTEGAPLVAARTEDHPALPSTVTLLSMLNDAWGLDQ